MLQFREEDCVGKAMQIPKLLKAAIMNTAYLHHQIIQTKSYISTIKLESAYLLSELKIFTKHRREDKHCAWIKLKETKCKEFQNFTTSWGGGIQ